MQRPSALAPSRAERTPPPTTVRTRVPMPMEGEPGAGRAAEVVSFDGLPDGQEHLAVVFPGWQGAPLVRLHSECLTGDVFASQRCDCGPQLREAVTLIRRDGGILLYLRQEGRGIGLYNKLDAYLLQDGGADTFAANRMLDLAEDARDYTGAAGMLAALGVPAIKLLTNNPDKARQLRAHGVTIRQTVPTGVFVTDANRRYLAAKRDTAGHTLTDPRVIA